jgi:hypothetical protein
MNSSLLIRFGNERGIPSSINSNPEENRRINSRRVVPKGGPEGGWIL